VPLACGCSLLVALPLRLLPALLPLLPPLLLQRLLLQGVQLVPRVLPGP
jgi:hypothetical protein